MSNVYNSGNFWGTSVCKQEHYGHLLPAHQEFLKINETLVSCNGIQLGNYLEKNLKNQVC